MIPFEEALAIVRSSIKPLESETVPIQVAHTRYLSQDVASPIDLPLFDNTAVDGYAVHSSDLPGSLKVVGTVPAGEAADFQLEPGTTVKVMTGAPVPKSADTVVMREDVVEQDGIASFSKQVKPGSHIRRKGEEIAVGDTLALKGTLCTPPLVALLASAGVSQVDVSRRPCVGVLVTGDELVQPGNELKPGQIYESNGLALEAALREMGIDATVVRAKDDLESTVAALQELAKSNDLLITTGGVSVGDFDVVRNALAEIGATEKFWRVALKPGKPVCFSTIGEGKYVFGLPGNPVSVLVTYSLFVAPALLQMQGASTAAKTELATLSHEWSHATGRLEYARAFVTRNGDGSEVSLHKCQSSHMMSGLSNANALVALDGDQESFETGEKLKIKPLPWRTE